MRSRTVQDIGSEYVSPSERPDVVYRDVTVARSNPDERRYSRVLLVSPGAILFGGDLPRCTYPLGLGYLGAALENNGYEVKILDCLVEGYYTTQKVDASGDFVRYGLARAQIAEILGSYQPSVIGVSSIFSNQSDAIEEIFEVAREVCKSAVLITGGAHARYFPDQYLNEYKLDAVFLGESENTIVSFLDWLNGVGDLSEIEGVIVRSNLAGHRYENKKMPLIRNSVNRGGELDHIAFPAWHLYNMERYFEIGAYQSPYTIGKRVAQIYTSRGCTAKCTFCTTTNFWGGKLRRRSFNNVVAELKELIHDYRIDEYHIQDDNITNDKAHARDLFKALVEIGLPWCTPQGTALWRMDKELLDLMAASGCYQVTFAVESGVQRVLTELIQKPLNLLQTSHLVTYARSIGLDVHGFFIIGMPPMFGHEGETIAEMWDTYNYAVNAGFTSASFFTATPIVGSVLLTESVRQGFLKLDTPLYKMSYKQGLLDVKGLWSGREVAELANLFNVAFNSGKERQRKMEWKSQQY